MLLTFACLTRGTTVCHPPLYVMSVLAHKHFSSCWSPASVRSLACPCADCSLLCFSVCCCCAFGLSQPAVPFAGLFRLIDVPVSNCIHSGISNIYVLTQYNATSLNRHLSRAYQFLNGITFQGGLQQGWAPLCSTVGYARGGGGDTCCV